MHEIEGAMKNKYVLTAMTVVSVLVVLCVLQETTSCILPAAAAEQYTLGVVPQFEQRKLHAIWKPIVDELQRRTGLSFKLVTTLQVQEFEKELAKGSFDFVFANPFHIIQIRKTQGYLPLVCDRTQLHGVLVVKKDGPIRTVNDLDGKTVAFPSPNALGATLMMRSDLEQIHHVSVTPLYVKTHSSVYLHVANGLAAAGGGIDKTLQEQAAAVRDSLRVLYLTRAIPSHPVAAHPRVKKADVEKVRRAFLAMGAEPAGRELLAKVPIKEIRTVTMGDYLPMVNWGLERYWMPIQED
jgi:phosphonate transport system substrate-binding protein